MDFEPKTWVGGDTVTAAHLNRIEEGIVEAASSGGGTFIVNAAIEFVEDDEDDSGSESTPAE